jgi:hypothetical protein
MLDPNIFFKILQGSNIFFKILQGAVKKIMFFSTIITTCQRRMLKIAI